MFKFMSVVALAALAVPTLGQLPNWVNDGSNPGNSNPGQEGYGNLVQYLPLQFVVDPLLDQLFNNIWNLESRETAHVNQIEVLIGEADKNIEFMNRFNQIVHPAFKYHQEQQDDRISALEDRIAEIKALKQKVEELQGDANDINDVINDVIYPQTKKLMYDINDLQNADLERVSQIKLTKQRADDVNDRIDTLFEKAWDNTRDIDRVNRARLRAAQEKNVQFKVYDDTVVLLPNDPPEDVAVVPVTYSPVLGPPQLHAEYIIGCHVSFYKPQYHGGYPSIYFGIFPEVDNEQLKITSTEMSTGGWTTKVIIARAAGVYFSDQKLSLK